METPNPSTAWWAKACHRELGQKPERGVVEAATVQLAIVGMRCDDCVQQVRKALMGHDGVLDVEVRLASASATVTFDSGRTSPRDLLEVVVRTTGVCPSMYRAIPIPESRWRATRHAIR